MVFTFVASGTTYNIALPIGCMPSGRGGYPTYLFISVDCCKGLPMTYLDPISVSCMIAPNAMGNIAIS
eukprot:3050236-Pleurochrysis_carterae.AAC.3